MPVTPGKWGLPGERKEGKDHLVSVRTPWNSWDTSVGYDELLQVWGDQERWDDGVHAPTDHSQGPSMQEAEMGRSDIVYHPGSWAEPAG